MKAPSPLLGFNNNVRHKGRVFHIQTEDSGIRHPHIITHLFADGGRILKTTKTSYAEHVGQDRIAETVRAMMQEQHKAMFIALRDGQFDYLFEDAGAGPQSSVSLHKPPVAGASGGIGAPAAAAPAVPTAPVASASAITALAPAVSPPSPVPPPVAPPAARSQPAAPPPPRSQPAMPPPPMPGPPALPLQIGIDTVPPSRKRAASRPKLDVDAAAIHGVGGTPPGMLRGEPSIDLDLDALERAAAEAQTPFFQQIQDLPPPPAAVLGTKRPSPGGYSVRGQTGNPPAGPPPIARSDRPPHGRPSPAPAAPQAASARYAPSRPASIFATTRPQEGSSIFGEDLISEKSLDEVILSYLAEDLDSPGEKK